MKEVFFSLFGLLTSLAKLIGPGGSRTIIAENLLLKQQLIIHVRSRYRAPNMTAARPFPTRFLVAVFESAPINQGGDHRQAIHATVLSQRLEVQKVPDAVFTLRHEEAWAKGTIERSYRRDCRDEAAEPSVRLSAHRTTDLTTTSVPTPASSALFGIGLAGLGRSRRKKQS